MARELQSHGGRSKIYVPVLLHIFRKKLKESPHAEVLQFTMKDIVAARAELGLDPSNKADLVYRMKSRTRLPDEITSLGFRVLRPVQRGVYQLEKAESTLIDFPDCEAEPVVDATPAVVRNLLGDRIGHIDEQALLSIVRYNDLLSKFLGMPTVHFKGHVRKSVRGVGQAEIDDVHVSVPLSDEPATIIPVEAKAKDEPINRAQIAMQVIYARTAFVGHPIRPVTVKLFENGDILFIEFENEDSPSKLAPIRFAKYRLLAPVQHATGMLDL